MTVHVAETAPGEGGFGALVNLFDRYRQHYGQAIDEERSEAWLREATTSGPMRAFLARVDGVAAGICLVAVCPASLILRQSWSIRDLFVDPDWRRTGVAQALLDAVRTAAEERGVLRLSLQTEDDNTAALRLYERYGFRPVIGLRQLSLDLPAQGGRDRQGSASSATRVDRGS